jgi:hypothetical protein
MQLLIESTSKSATKRLEKLERRIGGSTEMMEEVATLVASKNKAGFKKGVKLQPATIEYKEKYGDSEEPLVESGVMKDELTTEKGVKLLRPTELRFGSSSLAAGEGRGREITVAKAVLLQKGTKHQKKHKVLKVTVTTRKLISDVFMKYVTER